MASVSSPSACLAPVQIIMLRDSLREPLAGHHVEQVEIVFARDFEAETIAAAWDGTVAATEVLRMGFDFAENGPMGWHPARDLPEMEFPEVVPGSWETWREEDRGRTLLFADTVPWRVVCWPDARRLVWTFHHALLDGRSIARIVRGFVSRLGGGSGETFSLSEWRAPSQEEIATAAEMFRNMPDVPVSPLPGDASTDVAAVRCLGNEFLLDLEARAAEMRTTAASLVTRAWGCALAEVSGAEAVLVEQIRAGAPQPGTAGFTMNVLPLVIRKSGDGGVEEFLADLGALRGIESVSAGDFPEGGYPDVGRPEVSTVMVEHGTLDHVAGDPEVTASVVLHERTGDATNATAHLRPELRLEVEGPWRQLLLGAWVEELERVMHPE